MLLREIVELVYRDGLKKPVDHWQFQAWNGGLYAESAPLEVRGTLYTYDKRGEIASRWHIDWCGEMGEFGDWYYQEIILPPVDLENFEVDYSYTQQARPLHASQSPWEWRSVADLTFKLHRLLTPGYGEPYNKWAFYTLDGTQRDQTYICEYGASGHAIFDTHYGPVVFKLDFDDVFGLYYRYVCGEIWF